MQPYFADVLCAVDADAFVFDAFSNPDVKTIEERLFPFIEAIQTAHPGKPLIFLSTLYRERRNFDKVTDDRERAKQRKAEQMMAIACKKYKDIYFLKTNATSKDHNTSVDGIHPDNHGYILWVKSIEKPIVKILKKYGIQ
jgi:lysophospholipase L1-like esterase